MKAMSSRDQTRGLHIRNLCIYYCDFLWDLTELISSPCSDFHFSRISPLSVDCFETFWKVQNFNWLKLDKNSSLLGHILWEKVKSSQSIRSEALFQVTKIYQGGSPNSLDTKESSLVIPRVNISNCVLQKKRRNISQVFASSLKVKTPLRLHSFCREKDWALGSALQTA